MTRASASQEIESEAESFPSWLRSPRHGEINFSCPRAALLNYAREIFPPSRLFAYRKQTSRLPRWRSITRGRLFKILFTSLLSAPYRGVFMSFPSRAAKASSTSRSRSWTWASQSCSRCDRQSLGLSRNETFFVFLLPLLLKVPETQETKLFSFLNPLAVEIWIFVFFAYCLVIGLAMLSTLNLTLESIFFLPPRSRSPFGLWRGSASGAWRPSATRTRVSTKTTLPCQTGEAGRSLFNFRWGNF